MINKENFKIKYRPFKWLAALVILGGWVLMAACGEEKVEETPTPSQTPTEAVVADVSPTPTYAVAPSFTPTPTPTVFVQRIVCIDPGHQEHGNADQEPLGPGSSETKNKVTGGATGIKTKTPEYQLNLTVSLLLRTELESRGYLVVMTRTENDVDISNMERAFFASENEADIFVRIHANSSSGSASGACTICQTKDNPYNGNLYGSSRLLSQCILDCFVAATGAKNDGIWETDTMSGINWSAVPVTILEMGYLSDKDEDVLMSDPDYQEMMVAGIADGIDLYFIELENAENSSQ